jgi:3-dehydroquinate dehydratase-2
VSNSASSPAVLIIHGPNLDLLGGREPEIYGSTSLAQLDAQLRMLGNELGLQVDTTQSNHEGAIIEAVHGVVTAGYGGLVINPGGFTHTSVAIHDALRAVSVPAVEVHLTNLYARESFRHHSMTGAACHGVIMGFGVHSYGLALRHLAPLLCASLSK